MFKIYTLLVLFNFFLIYFFNSISKFINIYDIPNEKRKLHLKKIPNIGGLLLFINLLFFFSFFLFFPSSANKVFLKNSEFFLFFLFITSFLILGLLDDKYNLNANHKFILFFLIIYLLMYADGSLVIKKLDLTFLDNLINIESISIFFTVLSFLLFINAFNMFDGINMQASLYSIFVFIFFIIKNIYPEFCFFMIISLLFFLYLNYKNKCFLGDNGSLMIASIIAYFSVKSANSFISIKADEIFLLMLVPGLDLLRLSITRILNGNHPFSADRNHIHHLLLKIFSLSKTLFIILSLVIVPNILSLFFGYTFFLIIFSILIYLFLLYAII
jgi:UDP-GlcNAc:undecaprenyl-phosphate GlcNAc-1-phosphate transferase